VARLRVLRRGPARLGDGAPHFLQKPFPLSQLTAWVRTLPVAGLV